MDFLDVSIIFTQFHRGEKDEEMLSTIPSALFIGWTYINLSKNNLFSMSSAFGEG